MSIYRKVLTTTLFAATILCGAGATVLTTSSPAAAQVRPNYGGFTYLGNASAYTFAPRSGQMGNVTFFGGRPVALPSRPGQMGNVTFLGGARPYALPSRSGQYGGVTYFGPRPMNAVPIRTVPTPGVIRIR
ncbi:hypothetical protein LJR220_007125 [Bradyrhizobium sp. LjRoot220]|uniref:hypothetical protein n=1 Tax=Bradyrhizobium sp. LjRoot220 TaxID=3342284 RepID=UPI003ECF3228